MLISDAIAGFLIFQESTNKSASYIAALRWDLHRYAAVYGHLNTLDMTSDHLRNYLAFHQRRGLAAHSLYSIHKHLRVFFKWCEHERLMPLNPLRDIPPPRLPSLLPKSLSEEQAANVLSYLKKQRTRTGVRNYTIVCLFLDTGLRVAEMAHLRTEDINLTGKYLIVRGGKGNKDRVVPLSSQLIKLLWRYLADVRPRSAPATSHLWIGKESNPLDKNAIASMVKRTLRALNIPHGGPHIFRHTFATLYLRNGGDLERLRQILGHSSIVTTQVYVHLVPDDLIARHNEISPVMSLRF